MISHATYQAAKFIAPLLNNYFEQYIIDAAGEDKKAHQVNSPSSEFIEALIDAAFWASLRKEEGNSPKISIAFLSPEQTTDPLLFGSRLRLTPRNLTKIAPGVEGSGIHLGVWFDETGLYIWGTTLNIPNYCFVLDVSEPALLVVKHRRLCGFGKFTNVAILKGDEIKVIDENSAFLPDSPQLLNYLLGLNTNTLQTESVNVLIQLAVSMRAHQKGGIILIVPTGSNTWHKSIVHPIQYLIDPVFTNLSKLVNEHSDIISEAFWESTVKKEIDNIAGLSAVDGAIILNDTYELLAFGTKIIKKSGAEQIDKLAFIEPIIGAEVKEIFPGELGGTRHLSAAQFIYDQRDATALVASQDGHFTVFSWSPERNMVQSYRIDTLLI
ncbi:putative sensor domain DACNV-containing protein [Pseudopedobacter beijingensis]|uniref:Sensor domain DACNV-containing protein n=1 Tax=Pseudopedobacter beijingensis TaxID=1207056 RepID=A0ABW4IF15_9SPHI